ncbi:MAG: Asp-tRNA(Asn)/Glu-tRNA(Gln) amidotransferase subunit GatA [Bacteroides sp.]|nr:Asp-tRNA(Asn)/Glu-tRNA(Gln) amidotransferase subunit GatA [Prevotella sp.]MCM1408362.1 Asp-tRNA(Asn)/Glu-tRNA(Gln) amidotransferase subunit GatA [Treponema brennaborense]MCM1470407.1 Asp-tRNA(Asn)/Glu-tRNA(Gln) amidotransferase subunit GatA [Bacteroides sp.]
MDSELFSIADIKNAFRSGSCSAEQLVRFAAETFAADQSSGVPLNAFLEIYDDALAAAQAADEEITAALRAGTLDSLFAQKPLIGIPFAVKDNISVKGKRATCSSKILEGYTAPYDATVIARLKAAGAIPIGRCNQDEFAMGSSTEYSIYGPTRNPIDRAYVSGGSSGGSAAAVASNQALFALGTETGGSVRLPASYCGVYGLKPTYGVLSRWGVVAYGSSLDQVGIIGHTPADIALPLSVMAGADFYDDTSADLPGAETIRGEYGAFAPASADSLAQLKIAVPKQFLESEGLDAEVAAVFEYTKNWFTEKGASVEVVDIPVLNAAIASYYVIALSEAASNLSRFDGIRYGKRLDTGEGYDELYIQTRSSGFGPEVKRRIVIGNYVLSEQFSGDCYKKGMAVRARIQREISQLFDSFDLILCPTCPTAAFRLGQKVDDPLEMYLSDLFTTFVNLARIPSLSVPAGYTSPDENGVRLPIGVQFAGAMFGEEKILRIAQAWECDHPGCGVPVAGSDAFSAAQRIKQINSKGGAK